MTSSNSPLPVVSVTSSSLVWSEPDHSHAGQRSAGRQVEVRGESTLTRTRRPDHDAVDGGLVPLRNVSWVG
jgi:hypothetical protein